MREQQKNTECRLKMQDELCYNGVKIFKQGYFIKKR